MGVEYVDLVAVAVRRPYGDRTVRTVTVRRPYGDRTVQGCNCGLWSTARLAVLRPHAAATRARVDHAAPREDRAPYTIV